MAQVTSKSTTWGAAVTGVVPSPASRPRVTKWGTYFVKAYVAWAAGCQKQFAEQLPKHTFTEPLAVEVNIFCKKPKTGKLKHPVGDVDNYVKGVLDAATKAGVWEDDKQIVELLARKQYSKDGSEGCTILVSHYREPIE